MDSIILQGRKRPLRVGSPEPRQYVPISYSDNADAKGYIYIFECAGHFKVGLARDVERRRLDLQPGCPFPIRLVAYRSMPAYLCPEAEALAHHALAQWHVHSEWFLADKAVVRAAVHAASREALRRHRANVKLWEAKEPEWRAQALVERERVNAEIAARPKLAQAIAESRALLTRRSADSPLPSPWCVGVRG